MVAAVDDHPEDDAGALAAGVPTELDARTLAIVGGLIVVGVVAIAIIVRNIQVL